jgi:acyl-coenzyme A synthetase/AMP-(fatty) acid ligase
LVGAEIVRDPSGGRDIEKITELLREGDTTHLSAVPLTISRLASTSEGERLLHGLQGGVVGGAPVSPDLADFLTHTRLRTGYGQTEASPGITLGEPGIWEAHYIGNPLGCLTQIDEEGQLLFAGENACLGFWQEGALHRLDPKRWVATGDIVREQENGLIFLGRVDDAFKLANGKRIQAGPIESCLKAKFPAIREALLTSRDGETLTLCVGLAPGVECPPFPALLDCLGAIGGRLHLVRVMPEGMFVHTAKGSLNRKATIEALL